MKISCYLLLVGASLAGAFSPIQTKPMTTVSTTRLHLIDPDLVLGVPEARSAFFIWFFGASGAAGIARNAFPRMYASVQTIRGLKDAKPTKGGETVGISSLCGYPQDLSKLDVDQVLGNRLSVEQIVNKFPVEGNFLSAKGYLTFDAFERANKDANPLAIRAVFDCFAQSTDVVNPEIGQQKLDSYRANIESLKSDLLKSKLQGWAAIIFLLGLLGLADITAFGHAYSGWFPDWPGGRENLPWGLFAKETGPWTIPNYWI